MPIRNGRQLGANCLNESSTVERRFFDVLYRWSRARCTVVKPRKETARGFLTKSLRHRPLPASVARPLPSPRHDPYQFSTTSSNYISSTNLARNIVHHTTVSDKVRTLMRSVPNPVVVITTIATNPKAQPTDPTAANNGAPDRSLYRGMTLSSFTTLALHPQALITFNIRFPSRTLTALASTRHFLLHILEATPEGAALAGAFTKGNAQLPTSGTEVVQKVFDGVAESGGLMDMKHLGSPGGYLPRLVGNEVKYVLECTVLGEDQGKEGGLIRIGDHVLVVAKVANVYYGGMLSGQPSDAGDMLKDEEGGMDNPDDIMANDGPALSYAFGTYGRFHTMRRDAERLEESNKEKN